MNHHFTKEKIHGKEAHEKMSYIISEMQINHLIPSKMPKRKNKQKNTIAPNAGKGKDAKELDSLHVADWIVQRYSHSGKQFGT